jgi:hypothetical protein
VARERVRDVFDPLTGLGVGKIETEVLFLETQQISNRAERRKKCLCSKGKENEKSFALCMY